MCICHEFDGFGICCVMFDCPKHGRVTIDRRQPEPQLRGQALVDAMNELPRHLCMAWSPIGGVRCTLPLNHLGNHVAHDPEDKVIAGWA
jgi:hypothetical protein